MSVITNNLLQGDDGYNISRSVRLRSSASAYFNRTFGTPTNGDRFTWSSWAKRGALNQWSPIFNPNYAGGEGLYFNASNQIVVGLNGANLLVSNAVYRDPSAFLHIIAVADMSNATAALRFRVYVNGSEITSWATDARASYTTFPYWNKNTVSHYVGYTPAVGNTFDGYLTEINFIDGQALTPSSFGETDAITGVWKPKKYTGTYGTNGFYLNFSDNSSNTSTTIGKDWSGNGNNWTPNNISVTAGVTYDSMLDVPTMWADGGNGRGNYATWNPTIAASTGVGTITNGNLQCVTPTSGASNNYGTIGMSSGKWYWEITATARTTDSHMMIGINDNTQSATEFYSQSRGYAYRGNGEKWNNGSGVSYGSAAATGDIIGIAFDADSGSLELFRNGSSMGVAFTGISASTYFPAICDTGTSVTWTATANFGQRPFAYTPPTGFKALNTQNLPDATIKKGGSYFNAVTYTGNGATGQTISGAGFQPDLVWVKSRSAATDNGLQDAVRGATKDLNSNNTDAEETRASSITAFTSDGFTLGGNDAVYNSSGATYVGWQWKESVSSGFDIVTYTGNGSTQNVAHSLGVAPKMVIVKQRDSGANSWFVYHASTGAGNWLALNLTNAITANTAIWNNTAPTSSVFSVGVSTATNGSAGSYLAYLFSEVAGYSKFGSYTGNGSTDGPFVYTGFRPAYVLVKRSDSTGDWNLHDTARDSYNVADKSLFPNVSNAEATPYYMDIVSNGFKIRDSGSSMNTSSGTYIFAAFAENPTKYSLAR
jgi:hypothetical protein